MVCDEAEPGGVSAGVPEDDEPDVDEHEEDEGGDLDEGEREFEFPEDLDGDEVEQEDGQRADPLGDVLDEGGVLAEPGDVDGGGVYEGGHGPVEPVQPAGDEGGFLAVELTGVGDEGAGRRAVDDEFAEGAEDEVAEEPADGVDDHEGGPGVAQAASGAEEQAGADGSPDGDHLELAGPESALEPLVLIGDDASGGDAFRRRALWRGGGCAHGGVPLFRVGALRCARGGPRGQCRGVTSQYPRPQPPTCHHFVL